MMPLSKYMQHCSFPVLWHIKSSLGRGRVVEAHVGTANHSRSKTNRDDDNTAANQRGFDSGVCENIQ